MVINYGGVFQNVKKNRKKICLNVTFTVKFML